MEPISKAEDHAGKLRAFSSFILALLICSKLINASIAGSYSGGIQTGLITMSMIWAFLLLYYVLGKVRKANLWGTVFIIYILSFFAVSYVTQSGHISELTVHFIEYGLLGYLIAGTDYDFEKATRYSGYILIILVVPTFQLIQNSYGAYENILGMSESYTLLPPISAILVHFLYYRKKKDWIMYVAYSIACYVLVTMFFKGIRGSILCLFAMIVFAILNLPRFRGKMSDGRLSLILVVFLVMLNIDTAVEFLAQILSANNIHIRFLEKSARLGIALSGDLSNGRTNIYSSAFSDFLKSPIWGNGIGYFPSAHNIIYPHNIILQVLAEGGILLGIPIIGIIIYCIYALIFGIIENSNYRISVLMLASCTIPAAFVSDELWNYQLLWLLFGILIKKRSLFNYKLESENERNGQE